MNHYQIGDLIVVRGVIWTIIENNKNRPIILENSYNKIISIHIHEIKDWMKLHIGSKYYPVIQ